MPHLTRNMLWLGFFASILLAWVWMYMMAAGMNLDLLGRPMTMGDSMERQMDGMAMMTRFGPLFAMWAIMMAAMMLPTLVPTLRAYDDLMHSADGTFAGWVGVLAGYFIVWVLFAAVIATVQLGLLAAGVIDICLLYTSPSPRD